MKPIKINDANIPALTEALAAVNGKATAHTLCSGAFILSIVAKYEKKALSLLGAKKHLQGTQVVYVSGGEMPKAYKYSRVATSILLERRSSDWYLVNVESTTLWNSAGPEYIKFTEEQDAAAVAHLRREYTVIKSKATNELAS